jgi:DHA1 family bicyclomycin/chloramphenicol resistance-like MFS transporter
LGLHNHGSTGAEAEIAKESADRGPFLSFAKIFDLLRATAAKVTGFVVNHRALIWILAALSMMGALSIDAYLPALPSIAQAFAVPLAAVQQTLTVYLFAFAFMSLFYGTLSDSFGRRPVILVSLTLYFLSSIGAACSTSLSELLVFRVLQGLSAGSGSVVGRAIVGDLLTGAEAQRAMAYISVIFGLAPAIAPILGGWLQAGFGWRSIFLFIALFTLALLAVCFRLLPESLPLKDRHAFHFRVIVANYWRVGRHGRFMFQSMGNALAFSGIMLYVGAAPAFVMKILHLSVKDFGWLFIPLIGGMTFGSYLAGQLSHRWTPWTLIRRGYGIMFGAALANLGYTLLFVAALPWAVLPLFCYGIGMSLAMPAMSVMTLEMFPRERGLAASLQGFLFMSVFALGSGVVCPLLFDSAAHLASGAMAGLILSLLFWWWGTRESAGGG